MRWFKRTALLILMSLFSWAMAAEAPAETEIMVSAALSLKASFEEIGRSYERRYPGSRAVFNFGPSGALQRQIEAGAPADLFASASPKEIDLLEKAGLIAAGSRVDFAGNSVVLITSLKSGLRSLNDLKSKEITRIAIGNPATVPAGKYAEETLKSAGLWDILRPKLIYAEHVRQVTDYVARNEVDAGMVFLTDALSRSKEIRVAAEAAEPAHSPVIYTLAVIKGAKNEASARNFIALVLSKEGREILRKNGFRTDNR